ncbi:hypothetical protein CXF83_02750 [Shewanella sp. Choline-02u-19]|uniref:hypothetical protein n=1 Tax=unclassified Shewanella TaxID=196818 RepID=UPI000C3468F8|nr:MULTISPECIES: hypothetical protein [unclassified Shewanella]PKH57297.1 hypothetical protein CXF84_10005 [Shewanella sp. Bg11-22]PKI29589.1 hypothetical protein CXF83_02750 [Shewanella sp. Choline-02u-19]
MESNTGNNIKSAMLFGLAAIILVGCGSSAEEDQLAWIQDWNSSGDFQQKMKMMNTCFKEAGVRSLTKSMTSEQSDIVNACELSYIIERAEDDDISLDRELLAANILQL